MNKCFRVILEIISIFIDLTNYFLTTKLYMRIIYFKNRTFIKKYFGKDWLKMFDVYKRFLIRKLFKIL